ncbi:DUF1826 domain-containing protein [Paracoccus laeviglucosivorans]|uniref:DUF1826 domain-containing protein n=1 Tax=Paracoccus laeviglucosivorans TaxID=1197861 RepID=A0A521FRI9_9RHOB|nr:DUF1826 domain-containing protein [Paracoccus laeviglucosivorans]SMO98845.1 Protein of unknown function [Paracoccus laeviglucosivorans]
MNVIAFPRSTDARGILQSHDVSVLNSISAPGIAAAIWQRQPMVEFSRWIDDLPVHQLPRLRTIVAVGSVTPCIHAACDLVATPKGQFRDMLANDITAMAQIMTGVMDAPMMHLRLEVVETDACRKFHIDNKTARMLCTYRGAGTQLAEIGQEAAPSVIGTGSIALLRGKRWPGEATALLHRSPPIEATGQVRLLAVIDPAWDFKK